MNGWGYTFISQTYTLLAFCRTAGNPELATVTGEDLNRYLSATSIGAATSRYRHSTLARFFEFWHFREEMPHLAFPSPRRKSRQLFMPYVYSEQEIKRLIMAVEACQADINCSISSSTLKSLLLTLYATGARLGEILGLQVCDLTDNLTTLTLRETPRGVRRQLPVNGDLRRILVSYIANRHQDSAASDPLFSTIRGRSIPETTLGHTYRRLCNVAGVVRSDGTKFRPRLNDFRATFAVSRITNWIRDGSDLNCMLPALAVYMGHGSLTATEHYLQKAPERFRQQLHLLDSN